MPIGHRARPVAAVDATDGDRVRQREIAHRRVPHARVDLPLVLRERCVHLDVAVDRGATLEPERRVRRAAVDGAAERQRAGLRADDREAGRLRDQAGVEAVVALERCERAEPAVLLRGDALEHDLRRLLARRAQRRQPFMSTLPRP